MSSRSTAPQHNFEVLAFLLKSVDVSCSQLGAIMHGMRVSAEVKTTGFRLPERVSTLNRYSVADSRFSCG